MVGDASWLMMSSEVVTSVQENTKLTIILIDNHGFGSIAALSESVGSGGFGTEARDRGEDGEISGGFLPVDLKPFIQIQTPLNVISVMRTSSSVVC